ncbi:MAG: response regulator, partial [Candidatus Thiodiazotropha sp.]
MQRILIVEDEPEVREMIRYILEPKGYLVDEAGNAQEARQQLALRNYDLILMDWMLPGRSGLDLTRELKQNFRQDSPPVIMLTARSEETDKVSGLDSGADDYITKPFSTREMLARIKAVIRRGSDTGSSKLVEFAGLSLDPGSHLVSIDGKP